MAGEHNGDASFYDFLIDDPEMPMPMPTPATSEDRLDATPNTTGRPHLDHLARLQQPISSPNRTSAQPQRHLPNPVDALHPPITSVASHVAAPPQPHLAARHQQPDPSRAASRPLLHSLQHPAVIDLHANDLRAHHHPHSAAPLAPASYSAPMALAPAVSSMPMDWGLYGVAHPSMPLNQSPFDFEVPTTMMTSMPHHAHLSPTVSDAALGYGNSLVSPSSIHSSQSHYAFSSSWEDSLGHHEGTTPTVTTPAAQISTNPWTDPEELQQETDRAQGSRPKKAPRSRKQKKDARKSSDAGTGPSPEAGSPSSASQNSRASVASKATSMASSVVSSSSASSRLSKLRSASRTSKNSYTKPSDTPEERRTRASHNLVEKQYRNRLNSQFESLLNALPEQIRTGGDGEGSDGGGPVDWGDRRVSKGEVLEMARKHIETLERERDMLEREKNELQGSLHQLKNSVSEGEGTLSPAHNTPLNFNISMDDDDEDDGPV
ncbi:hypothetical protein G7Z17_g12582 [Cylindrodendrum hubeiense]|uniref:BHLH domain-containing protein n=1 Tax=Cylindrodendrum hubeiense TaxID=595255 RepID=A0A9P5H1P2_9HYPO|nr:hypothetical protein G7Z17_g12582 [Cylindrodendrum hubeiense]